MNDLTYPATQENSFLNTNTNSNPSTKVIEKVKNTSALEIYEGLFQHSFHPMYIENTNGLIMKFSEKFSKLFGYSQVEMSQLENKDLFEMKETAFIDFLDQRNEKGIAKAEITAIKKTGKRFPCRISSVIYESDSGDKRAMNTLVDISNDLSARWDFSN